jgi:hypothetical protein
MAILSQSNTRVIILGILMVAVILLSYSVSLWVGQWLQRRFQPHARKQPIRFADRFAGGFIAVFTAGLVLWIIVAMFGPSTPAGMQRELKRSAALSAIVGYASLPPIFSTLVNLIHPFGSPTAFIGAEPSFDNAETATQEQYASLDTAISRVTPSVVRIKAWGCGTTSEGSGFLVGKDMIMTNAHVVAGAERISVQDRTNSYTGVTVWFDPALDAAILKTEVALPAEPLTLRTSAVPAGTIVATLGYPNGGDLASGDGTILQLLNAKGFDIYGRSEVVRSIYAVRSTVQPGGSGGPMVTADGMVAGLVFGNSTLQTRTGYVIDSGGLIDGFNAATTRSKAVSTGTCTGI